FHINKVENSQFTCATDHQTTKNDNSVWIWLWHISNALICRHLTQHAKGMSLRQSEIAYLERIFPV
ncbi:MAG: hypothetical protein MR758_05880, partial [Bacteroidales bacterium]|nr:hypothetical protein [Bacteroidales bacterium]